MAACKQPSPCQALPRLHPQTQARQAQPRRDAPEPMAKPLPMAAVVLPAASRASVRSRMSCSA